MTKPSVFSVATQPAIICRSSKVSLIVGTLLVFINHFDELALIFSTPTMLLKTMLTYMVPYVVATYGAVSALLDAERNRLL